MFLPFQSCHMHNQVDRRVFLCWRILLHFMLPCFGYQTFLCFLFNTGCREGCSEFKRSMSPWRPTLAYACAPMYHYLKRPFGHTIVPLITRFVWPRFDQRIKIGTNRYLSPKRPTKTICLNLDFTQFWDQNEVKKQELMELWHLYEEKNSFSCMD